MSVVVKDSQNGKIILLSKGADEAILPYASAGEPFYLICSCSEDFSEKGLNA